MRPAALDAPRGLAFRPLAPADLATMQAWLQRPHVAEWWHAPATRAELERDYFPPDAEASSTRPCIALLDEKPIGFIQSYVPFGAGDGWWEDETDPGARGIDQFLADRERLGQGLGSAMAAAFVARLFADPAVTRVQADPAPTNARAIACYRRAGFIVEREVATPDGPALLMFCHRDPTP